MKAYCFCYSMVWAVVVCLGLAWPGALFADTKEDEQIIRPSARTLVRPAAPDSDTGTARPVERQHSIHSIKDRTGKQPIQQAPERPLQSVQPTDKSIGEQPSWRVQPETGVSSEHRGALPGHGPDRSPRHPVADQHDRGMHGMPGSPFDRHGMGDAGRGGGMPERDAGMESGMGPGADAKAPPSGSPMGRYGTGAVASGSAGNFVKSLFGGLGGTGGGSASTTDELLSSMGRDRAGGIQTAHDAEAFFGVLGNFNIPWVSKASEATSIFAGQIASTLEEQEAAEEQDGAGGPGATGSDDSDTDASGSDDSDDSDDPADSDDSDDSDDSAEPADSDESDDSDDNGKTEVRPGDPHGHGDEAPPDRLGIGGEPDTTVPTSDGRVGGGDDTETPPDRFGIVDEPDTSVQVDDERVGDRRRGRGPDITLEFQDKLTDPPRDDINH